VLLYFYFSILHRFLTSSFEIAATLPSDKLQSRELIYYSLAMSLRFLGEPMRAHVYAEKAYRADPNNLMIMGEYAHLLLSLCKWPEYNQIAPRINTALENSVKSYYYYYSLGSRLC
jgi:hypothetical protein